MFAASGGGSGCKLLVVQRDNRRLRQEKPSSTTPCRDVRSSSTCTTTNVSYASCPPVAARPRHVSDLDEKSLALPAATSSWPSLWPPIAQSRSRPDVTRPCRIERPLADPMGPPRRAHCRGPAEVPMAPFSFVAHPRPRGVQGLALRSRFPGCRPLRSPRPRSGGRHSPGPGRCMASRCYSPTVCFAAHSPRSRLHYDMYEVCPPSRYPVHVRWPLARAGRAKRLS